MIRSAKLVMTQLITLPSHTFVAACNKFIVGLKEHSTSWLPADLLVCGHASGEPGPS